MNRNKRFQFFHLVSLTAMLALLALVGGCAEDDQVSGALTVFSPDGAATDVDSIVNFDGPRYGYKLDDKGYAGISETKVFSDGASSARDFVAEPPEQNPYFDVGKYLEEEPRISLPQRGVYTFKEISVFTSAGPQTYSGAGDEYWTGSLKLDAFDRFIFQFVKVEQNQITESIVYDGTFKMNTDDIEFITVDGATRFALDFHYFAPYKQLWLTNPGDESVLPGAEKLDSIFLEKLDL